MADPARDAEKRGLAFLSLDGCRFESLSGLSQLFILREILRTYEFDHGLEEDSAKAYEVFDLIVGTGSGGLVACLIGPLRMSISQAIDVYLYIHRAVFTSEDRKISIEERTSRLKLALRQMIEKHLPPDEHFRRFSDFAKLFPGCMIVLTALLKTHVKYPISFRSYRGRRGHPPPCNLLEAILCTLAHPRLFMDVALREGSITQRFIGADLGHCNPLESLVTEVQDQYKDSPVAIIVSIGIGHPAHVRLEDANDFERAATELASNCSEVAERFKKMLPSDSGVGVFARLDTDGFDVSSELSADKIVNHTQSYIRGEDAKGQLDVIADRLKDRPRLIKATEILFPKATGLENFRESITSAISEMSEELRQVTRLTMTHDEDGYLYMFQEHINQVQPIRSGARGGIQSFRAKQSTGESILIHKFDNRQQLEEHIEREKRNRWTGWSAHFVGYSNKGDPFLAMRTGYTFDSALVMLKENDLKQMKTLTALKILNAVHNLPPSINVDQLASLGSLLRQPCFLENGDLSLDIPLLISEGILCNGGYKPQSRSWSKFLDRAQIKPKNQSEAVLGLDKSLADILDRFSGYLQLHDSLYHYEYEFSEFYDGLWDDDSDDDEDTAFIEAAENDEPTAFITEEDSTSATSDDEIVYLQ